MTVEILSIEELASGRYARASCGRCTACVSITTNNDIWVVSENSSHRVWRGAGRRFKTVAEALEGYKTAEMKSIIQAVADWKPLQPIASP